MPIQFSIDAVNGLIHTTVTGDLTLEATVQYFKDLQSASGYSGQVIEIVDFTGVSDFAIRYSDMRSITKIYATTKQKSRIRATIFLCPNDLSYGIGRMLEVLHDIADPGHVVRLARKQEDVQSFLSELGSG